MTIMEKIYSKYKELKKFAKDKYNSLSILDRYILKQLLNVFIVILNISVFYYFHA